MDKITLNLTTEEISLITRSLSDSMNYKPKDRFNEKWSLLMRITREEAELENKKEEEQKKLIEEKNKEIKTEENVTERCPWYVALGRFMFTIAVVALGYLLFLGLISSVLRLLNPRLGCWDLVYNFIQNNPALAIVVSLVGYVVFLVLFIYNFTKSMLTYMPGNESK